MPSKTGEDRICTICGIQYYVSGWRLKRGNSRFCSSKCQNHIRFIRPVFKCAECKKEFTDSPSRKGKRIFCSIECHAIAEMEKKLDARKKRREAIARMRAKGYRANSGPKIRKFVLESNPNKCQYCGYDEYLCCLDVHHIDDDPNNNSLKNLAILCVLCHRKVHRKIISLI